MVAFLSPLLAANAVSGPIKFDLVLDQPVYAAGQPILASLTAKNVSNRPAVLAKAIWDGVIVDDGERAAMGITVGDRVPTAVGAPTSKAKPAGVGGCEIWLKPNSPSSWSEARGGGGRGVEVCERSELPTELTECKFLATDSRTPYTANFDGSEANQTAYILDSLRSFPLGGIFDIGGWMSTRNEPGPVPAPPNGVRETKSGSETISATVTG